MREGTRIYWEKESGVLNLLSLGPEFSLPPPYLLQLHCRHTVQDVCYKGPGIIGRAMRGQPF